MSLFARGHSCNRGALNQCWPMRLTLRWRSWEQCAQRPLIHNHSSAWPSLSTLWHQLKYAFDLSSCCNLSLSSSFFFFLYIYSYILGNHIKTVLFITLISCYCIYSSVHIFYLSPPWQLILFNYGNVTGICSYCSLPSVKHCFKSWHLPSSTRCLSVNPFTIHDDARTK